MKVSLNWLNEYIELPTQDPLELRNVLAALGHEVEGVEALEAAWSDVVIAKVLSIDAHPKADKVRVCSVTTGGDPIQVVCGAWNFGSGAVVPFALPGAVLPGDFKIGIREIRGVESKGMICSEKELDLGDDHTGILVLDDDAPIGVPFADWVELPDVVFDLTITPNRPDAMSMIGIARDLGAYYGVPLKLPTAELESTPGKTSTKVTIEAIDGCSRFVLREMKDVKIGPSPYWMKRRLRAAGMRPIANIVDVTNYVMMETGHPLHAFDGDRLAGDSLTIRWAEDGEKVMTLDDVERTLRSSDLVICDAEGPTSMAGVMGGARSEVVEATTRVLLEAASWDSPTILRTSRRHDLRSEASMRFERGVDPNLGLFASARAVRLLHESGGGTVVETPVDVIARKIEPREIELPISEVERTLGPGIDSEFIANALKGIGMEVEGDDPLRVRVPTFRPDVERPIDLIEEIARLRGFDWFGVSVPSGSGGSLTGEQKRTRRVRETLAGVGLNQAVNLSFVGEADLDRLGYPADHEARMVVRVINPLREEESLLRTTLLPGLLRNAQFNVSHGIEQVGLFEVGKVFFNRPDEEDPRIPEQPDHLGFVVAGGFLGDGLSGSVVEVDFYTAAGITRLVGSRLGIETMELSAADAPGYHPGRCAEVSVNGTRIGFVGELHPTAAEAYDLPGRIAVGELDLSNLVGPVSLRQNAAPSVFPRVEFDLAFLVDLEMPADRLLRVTRDAGGGLVESARVFDEYVGGSDGRKSLGIHYVLRANDRTLTNEDVAPVRGSMVEAAAGIGAKLRG